MTSTLIVTGGSGFVGYRVCQAARGRWAVHNLTRTRPLEMDGVVDHRIDLTDAHAVTDRFTEIRPDAVIHLAAASDPNSCERAPGSAARINVAATLHLVQLCVHRRIPFVFASSDLIFDGIAPPYAEADPVSPVNAYGAQKAAAERAIRRRYPAATICRLPLMFGTAPKAKRSGFLVEMIRRLDAGENLRLFHDEFRTPVDTQSGAQGLIQGIDWPGGTFHLGGRRRVSRLDMGLALAKILGMPRSRIDAVSLKDMPMAAPRAADVTLTSEKAYGRGYAPAHFDTSFEAAVRQARASLKLAGA